jgi:lysyl-tRNA synthetase class 1
VTIEGAGEDHNTKGGSRDVAAHCLKAIYGREAPMNIPYGFVLVGGAKMSSSKGLGVTARAVADFLPPEALRFLMLRTKPKSQANFEPTQEALVKLFNDLDRSHTKTFNDPNYPDYERRTYYLSEVTQEGDYFDCEFSLVIALVQMPHLDIYGQFAAIKGSALTEVERKHLDRRIHAARVWLEHYATPEERLTLQKSAPASASELTATQRAFCRMLGERVKACEWTPESLQAAVFDSARLAPIDQPTAFLAFYRVLLDNSKGPKAGNFLAFLEREDVVKLFASVPWSGEADELAHLTATSITVAELDKFAKGGKTKAVSATLHTRTLGARAFVEAKITTDDGKSHVRRVMVEGGASGSTEQAVRGVLPV